MKKIIVITLIILSWTSLSAIPLGTEFTYQGELKDSAGNPHNGTFDFQFEAFDLSVANTGVSLGFFVADDVEVVDGIFTTQIDFDGGAFFGDKVWLEISVRDGASTGGYTQLLPRQQVTATPFASHASFAENIGLNSVSTTEIINNTIDTVDLSNSSITSAKIADGTIATNDINSSQIQRRISASCAAGEFMQSVNQDGTPVCVAEIGGITTVTTTEIVDGTIQAVDIDNSQIQQRVNTVCSGGRVVKSINSSGVAGCVFPTPSDNSVTSAKVIDGSIVAVDVDTSQIQKRINGSCTFPEYLTSVTQAGDVVCARMPLSFAKVLLDNNAGEGTSIVIGTDGTPIISTYNSLFQFLELLNCQNSYCSSSLSTDAANTNLVGQYNSITIGANGYPVISYYDIANGNLKVIQCDSNTCGFNSDIITTLDGSQFIDVGLYTSIAMGTDNKPAISYYDATNGNLKVVKCGDPNCSETTNNNIITTLDGTPTLNVGQYSSIAIGNDNKPIISYYDVTNGNLKVIKCGDFDCSQSTNNNIITTVDGNPSHNVGRYSSIVINQFSQPFISYYDATNGNLKMADCGASNCSSPTIITMDQTTTALVGQYSSIAITAGSDSNPIISYYDATNGNLKVIVKNLDVSGPSIFGPFILDANGDVGRFTSITIGNDGNPIISYQGFKDSSESVLKVYSCSNRYCSN